MNAKLRKKLGLWRPDMHHRYDAALVYGGFWWVSQNSTAPYVLPEGRQGAGCTWFSEPAIANRLTALPAVGAACCG